MDSGTFFMPECPDMVKIVRMERSRNQIVTLKDIAAATGYSVNTVSHALRGKQDIPEVTRSKIRQTAEEMGYINNHLASSLRLGYTRTIAVILGDITNPHFAIMAKEIEVHAREAGYFSFLLNTDENEEIERRAIEMALNQNVDGIIICPAQHSRSNIEYLQNIGIPFIQIGRYFPDMDADYVICNDEAGGFQAADYLLQKGHRRILMLAGPDYISSAKERLAGFRRAFAERNLPLDERLIRSVPVISGGVDSVLQPVMDAEIDFTAVFAFSDLLAMDAWVFLKERGCRIPDDYSIVGFDNIHSKMSIPSRLTTISSAKTKMSIEAIDSLIALMSEPENHQKIHIVLDTHLIEGESVRDISETAAD